MAGTERIERILIAADKFKGSLTAEQVAGHVRTGLLAERPDLVVDSLPIADGGDGTVDAALAAGFTLHRERVTGPLGAPVTARFAVRGDTAVIEMAEASGLRLLPHRTFAPLTAGTRGTGELIVAALDEGARTIVLGVGGSATTDGGAGMLQALGARLLDAGGKQLPPGGAALRDLARVDLSGLDSRLRASRIVLASDVDNPLTGPTGAAAVYGPQKGAGPADVAALDAALGVWARVLEEAAGSQAAGASRAPGAGAAGGMGFGALAGLGAVFRPGVEVMMEVLGFHPALARADLVITGEGSLDEQTLHGKAPAGVAAAAGKAGKPVLAVCGRLAIDAARLREAGIDTAYALTDLESDPAVCMAQAGPLLERAARRLATDHLL
ncbi:glycerate kinase [Streptomyces calidiresistens]|uniref:Glycerate kinase n=1 Tax=Streptomyces calidiresistens TaxID=1485586 RepID=A0A7W3T0P7_9ACTN|nr:glycerate kinase [Streptomyces calidiresistens]MBB0228762.1 glycerate kinase [Streptomyces calidiresistens]